MTATTNNVATLMFRDETEARAITRAKAITGVCQVTKTLPFLGLDGKHHVQVEVIMEEEHHE